MGPWRLAGCLLVLTGVVLAADPASQAGVGTAAPAPLAPAGPALTPESCPVPTRTVCLPSVEKVTKTKTCYRIRCDQVCLTYHAKCQQCGECGRPREVRKLIKRFVKEEVCEPHCKPQVVPVECAAPCPPRP